MPWWGWIVSVLGATVILFVAALRTYRAGIRRKVLDELARAYPELKVVEERASLVRLAAKGGAVIELRLGGLYVECSQAKDDAAREALVRRFLASLHESAAASGPLSMAGHGDRLLPRLATPDFLREAPTSLPHRALNDSGLIVVYVLDRPRSVEYVTSAHLTELGIDAGTLHARAMDNLRRIADVRGDGHDAARLLLVPERLAEGTSTTAAVPDANTLALGTSSCPPPGAKPLLPGRVLKVTRDGIFQA